MTNKTDDNEPVTSPCIAICALDENDICVGCYRSGNEISHWGLMSNKERREVLVNVSRREQASGNIS
jgi:predicted Fe-S protein YdhL (DUF1289 family)